jgi:sulfane dehydrogenase subunit SoxC
MTTVDSVSPASRVAEPGEGITPEELRLAGRNHAMPLEALHYDVTPAGLHYLLIHYDIPPLVADGHTLAFDGLVDRPATLTLDDLRARPRQTQHVTLECAGNGRALLEPRPLSQPWLAEAVGSAEWTGTPLAPILRDLGIADSAHDVVFTGADHGVEKGVEQDYQRGLPLAEALRDDVLLAYEMNGQPLLPQHGAPLRLVVPGWYGMAHVKWLTRITVIDHEFDGYQNAVAYRLRQAADDPGVPVTRIEPRALVRPPGFPDFMSRTRVLRAGPTTVDGRAWSGHGPIASVEVTLDGGKTWSPAELLAPGEPYAWRGWRWSWDARPGRYSLGARATDATGRVQPVDAPWNRGGFANNSIQRIDVVVVDG